jgi:hypothetical protein
MNLGQNSGDRKNVDWIGAVEILKKSLPKFNAEFNALLQKHGNRKDAVKEMRADGRKNVIFDSAELEVLKKSGWLAQNKEQLINHALAWKNCFTEK